MAGESILIVEDNDTNLRLFTYLLSSKGYDVRSVRDAPAS
jgi:CheY-like chemotaxis protein